MFFKEIIGNEWWDLEQVKYQLNSRFKRYFFRLKSCTDVRGEECQEGLGGGLNDKYFSIMNGKKHPDFL